MSGPTYLRGPVCAWMNEYLRNYPGDFVRAWEACPYLRAIELTNSGDYVSYAEDLFDREAGLLKDMGYVDDDTVADLRRYLLDSEAAGRRLNLLACREVMNRDGDVVGGHIVGDIAVDRNIADSVGDIYRQVAEMLGEPVQVRGTPPAWPGMKPDSADPMLAYFMCA